ncbi:MAG: hypothetical protein NTW86_01255 [Candidatus Sumerlaeota bacterium]|nr:hypothetical protein [Candidatus Sumerlaeota bacterium]
MTTAVRQLLDWFGALSEDEKQEAAMEVLRLAFASTPEELPEEALVAAAEELFLELDAREAADAQS